MKNEVERNLAENRFLSIAAGDVGQKGRTGKPCTLLEYRERAADGSESARESGLRGCIEEILRRLDLVILPQQAADEPQSLVIRGAQPKFMTLMRVSQLVLPRRARRVAH